MEVTGQRREQVIGQEPGRLTTSVSKKQLHVPAPGGIHPGPVSGARGRGLAHHHQVEISMQVVEVGVNERVQPGCRRRTWAERRRPAQDGLLEIVLARIEHGDPQTGSIAEAPVQGPLADAGHGRHLVHGHTLHSAFGEELLGRRQDACPVTCGIGPLRQWFSENTQLAH